MTAGELIAWLEKCNPNAEIVVIGLQLPVDDLTNKGTASIVTRSPEYDDEVQITEY